MTSKIFALEQRIMNCWNVVDDINDVYNYIGDNEFFTGMDAKHQDKILNLLLGMKELYTVKFENCFADFEAVTRAYHLNRKENDPDWKFSEAGEWKTSDWPEEDRIDTIGRNGNDGDHYVCEHKEIDKLMRIHPNLTYEQAKLYYFENK